MPDPPFGRLGGGVWARDYAGRCHSGSCDQGKIVVVFALAWLEKNKNNNNNYNNSIKKKGKTFNREIREGEACTSLGRCADGP